MVKTPNRVELRRGLVIREVVVLTILPTLLLSLMLPALHAVREATRRMMCSNNLKLQGLSLLDHEFTFRRLPAGCSDSLKFESNINQARTNRTSLYSWGAHLLPFQELGFAHSTLMETSPNDFAANFSQPESRKILESPLLVYRCPSDVSAPLLNIGRTFTLENDETANVALSNYVGSNGSGELIAQEGERKPNGLFWLNDKLRFASVLDGTSNTIAVGERAWLRKDWSKYYPRAAVIFGVRSDRDNSYYGIADALASGCYQMNFEAVLQTDGLGESYIRRGYSSNHKGGAQFMFADGSVRFLSEAIDSDMDNRTHTSRTPEVDCTWERLFARDDGYFGEMEF